MTNITDKIIVEKNDGIGHLILNQPNKRNAISLEMWQGIESVAENFSNDNEVRVVVFPDVDRQPAQFLEFAIDPAVAFDIAVEFLPPPVAICLRHGPVLRALVPEAAIHEHGYLRRTEYQVRCSRQTPQVRPVTQPS